MTRSSRKQTTNREKSAKTPSRRVLKRLQKKSDGETKPRKMSPASLANLKPPWKPGETGNPNGRPKALGDAYRQWLSQEVEILVRVPGERSKVAVTVTNAERVANSIGLRAAAGDVNAAKEIRSATEGSTTHIEGSWSSLREVVVEKTEGDAETIAPPEVEALGSEGQDQDND